MPFVSKRPKALSDLQQIWAYIAEDNPVNATKFLEQVDEKLKKLAESPFIGRQRNELFEGLRSFSIGRYIAYYIPLTQGIDLVRILHGSRDLGETEFF